MLFRWLSSVAGPWQDPEKHGTRRIGEQLQAEDGRTPKVLSRALRAEPEPVYNIEVDGDHCYRVGRQGLLVHNASAGDDPYLRHVAGELPEERKRKNTCNVEVYFRNNSPAQRILQIAAGPNVFPDALPEDILLWDGKTLLLVEKGEPLEPYLPKRFKPFSTVLVINARNEPGDFDYEWIFKTAAPVMVSGATITIVGQNKKHPSIVWVEKNKEAIEKRGFQKVSPTEPAPGTIQQMPGTHINPITKQAAQFSNVGAVQIVYKKT